MIVYCLRSLLNVLVARYSTKWSEIYDYLTTTITVYHYKNSSSVIFFLTFVTEAFAIYVLRGGQSTVEKWRILHINLNLSDPSPIFVGNVKVICVKVIMKLDPDLTVDNLNFNFHSNRNQLTKILNYMFGAFKSTNWHLFPLTYIQKFVYSLLEYNISCPSHRFIKC